jgi:hypothetical protein
MARANLGDLLGKLPDETPPEPPKPAPTVPVERPPAKPPTAKAAPSKPAAEPPAEVVEAGYLSFIRKDTRLREDQLEQLTKESRRLNRAKRNTGVRITDNTLIRIGVDLLLERIDRAAGDDEAALLRSLR